MPQHDCCGIFVCSPLFPKHSKRALHMNIYNYNSTESLIELLLAFKSTAVADIQYSIEANAKEALDEIIEVLQVHNKGAVQFDAIDVSDIANMGMQLFDHLNYKVKRNPEYAHTLNHIVLSFSFWLGSNGGTIPQLDFVVNTLATVSNATHEKIGLEALYEVVTYIIEAVPEDIKRSSSTLGEGEPWKVLVLNYCIISTRTHNPELMSIAFDVLLKYFPADAPGFFQQGQNEMEKRDYPVQVKTVIDGYCDKYPLA